MTIKILDNNTINRISAGEVVERPLNVVKELLENSLDAGAKNIIVEIEKAGKKTIRITDDGCGMDKQDLLLCVQRHATSKISKFDDLSNISTLGFRGEALPSIASVSMLDIKTQSKNSPSGWQYYMEGGKQTEIQPWAGSGGTIVEVKNLFFNTPVREKFLKSDTTEKAKIISCIDEIALVRNDIKFKIISDGKTIADYNKTDSKIKRIEAVLGKDLADKLKPVTISHPNINIEAFITSRQNALAQKNVQYLFVNGRCVNYPRWLLHALTQAQKQAIPVGKYIGIVMFLTTEQENIDINVHPTKREIKFAKENQMYELFYSFIKNALEEDSVSGLMDNFTKTTPDYSNKINTESVSFRNEKTNYSFPKQHYGKIYIPGASKSAKELSVSDYKNLYSTIQPNKEVAQQQELEQLQSEDFKFVGQIFSTYLLVEKQDTCFIIDQHAAQERIKYEQFKSEVESNSLKIQQMLFPDIFELSKPRTEILKNSLEYFNGLGLSIEEFGENTFKISAYPALLGQKINCVDMVNSVIDFFENETKPAVEQINDIIIKKACKSSIKAGDVISDKQAVALIADLFACKMPYTCPHGRPTVYKITHGELEKFFKRTN